MPSKLISIPFFLLTLVFLYLTWQYGESYSYFLIFLVIALAVIYALGPQIDWWWYKRNPPEIDRPMRNLLIKYLPFYNELSVTDKQKFRNRMALYIEAVDFIPKGGEKIPPDVQGVIAANITRMTFDQEDFLLSKFERIVIYRRPFPSPQFPKKFHASEIFEKDGVLLFSAEQVMWTFLQPEQYYNLVLHEYIKVYQLSYPNKIYPISSEVSWELLTKISGFNQEHVVNLIGLPDIDPVLVSGTIYFTHPKKYVKFAADLYKKWHTIFNPQN